MYGNNMAIDHCICACVSPPRKSLTKIHVKSGPMLPLNHCSLRQLLRDCISAYIYRGFQVLCFERITQLDIAEQVPEGSRVAPRHIVESVSNSSRVLQGDLECSKQFHRVQECSKVLQRVL